MSLREDNGFCCLGVACDIFRKEAKRGQWRFDKNEDQWYFHVSGDVSGYTHLLQSVSKWFGFKNDTTDPEIGGRTMVHMNDSLEFSFNQIADELESYINE